MFYNKSIFVFTVLLSELRQRSVSPGLAGHLNKRLQRMNMKRKPGSSDFREGYVYTAWLPSPQKEKILKTIYELYFITILKNILM